jgi:hypothetical protein
MLAQYEQLLNAPPEITRHEQPSARDHSAAARKRGSAEHPAPPRPSELDSVSLSR